MLDRWRERGLVGGVGVAGRGGELDQAMQIYPFEAVMTPVNPLIEPAHAERLARLAEQNAPIIAIEPLARGALAGKRKLRLRRADIFYAAVRALRPGSASVASPSAVPVAPQDALRWALAQPGVVSVLTTSTRAEHIIANAAALSQIDR